MVSTSPEQLPRFLSPEPLLSENSPLAKILDDWRKGDPLAQQALSQIIIGLSKSESHHIVSVLRMRQGAQCEILCPSSGQVFLGVLEETDSSRCAIRLSEPRAKSTQTQVTLIVGAPKFAVADVIVEKAVELGVSAIRFFNAERSARMLKKEEREKRLARMMRVRDAALKQSLSDTVTKIEFYSGLPEALAELPDGGKSTENRLICLLPGQGDLSETPKITDFFTKQPRAERMSGAVLEKTLKSDETYVLVGPEGGFERSEIDLAFSRHFSAVSLGSTRLRTETACILAAGTILLTTSS